MSKRKRDSKAVAGCERLDMLFDPGSFTEIGIHATYAAIAPDLEDLYDVINEGYGKVSILLTSNRDRAEWPDLFGEALLAPRPSTLCRPSRMKRGSCRST